MSALVDRLLRRQRTEVAGITVASTKVGPLLVIVQQQRGRTFGTHVALGRILATVGPVDACAAGVDAQVAFGPTRVRWIRRDPGPTGGIVVTWDGTEGDGA